MCGLSLNNLSGNADQLHGAEVAKHEKECLAGDDDAGGSERGKSATSVPAGGVE